MYYHAGKPEKLSLTGYSAYGGAYAAPSVKKSGHVVLVSGLPRGTGFTGIGAIQGEHRRPTGVHIFNGCIDKYRARVDISPAGAVTFVDGPHEGDWVNLSYIYGTKGDPLSLLNGWVNYGSAYAGAYAASSDGLVVLGGLVRSGKWEAIAKVPDKFRPSKRLIFSAAHHQGIMRVDVLPDGTVVYVAGKQNEAWVSLAGLCWSSGPGLPIAPMNGWQNYGGDYAPGTARACGKFISLSGLLKGSAVGVIGKLPAEMTPEKRHIFHTGGWSGSEFVAVRVDVVPDGTIQIVTTPGPLEWITLDGIVY